jgi:hypothetical protein
MLPDRGEICLSEMSPKRSRQMQRPGGIQYVFTRGDGMPREWSEVGGSVTISYRRDQKVDAVASC